MNQALVKQRAKQLMRRMIGEVYVGKRFKLRRMVRILPSIDVSPTTILDAGSEDAAFVYWLADRYPNAVVTAIDVDEDAIDNCRATRPAKYRDRVHFRVGDFSSLEHDSFDLITALDVLEHIEDDHRAVFDLASALRAGGALLVHVPRDQWTTRSGVVHRVHDEEAWRINPGHVRQGYSPELLRNLLTVSGLKVEFVETWTGRWGVLAFDAYSRLEHPSVLRLITVPLTEVCAYLDSRQRNPEGNTVFAYASKCGAVPGM